LLTLNYEVTQNYPFAFTNRRMVYPWEATYTKVGEVNLVADEFARLAEESLNYRLFTPEDTTIPQPLVLFLHGAGEAGTNNESQVRANMGATTWVERPFQKKHRSYVMAPQTSSSWSGSNLDRAYNVIRRLIDEGKVDSTRVYLVGLSLGGGGALTMLLRHPDMFAAALVNCPSGGLNDTQAQQLADTHQRIWLIQALNDTTVNPASTQSKYNLMVAHGVDAYYTTFPDVVTELGTYPGHWSWIYTYNNFVDPGPEARGPIMNWLFTNVRY
jgi:predicted peptidase